MFGIILVSIISAFHLYAFRRLCSIPGVRRRFPLKLIGAGAFVLWSIFFLGRVYGHGGHSSAASVLEFAGMVWMAALFLITVSFLVIDLITLFGLGFKKQLPVLRSCALMLGFLLTLIALVQGLRAPLVSEHDVRLSGLPERLDGAVMVVLSDMHLGNQIGAGWLSNRVAQVMAEKPDIILLVGDIYEGHDRPEPGILAAMRELSAPLGVWGVLGNHEFYGGEAVIRALTDESGVTVLRNSFTEIAPGLTLAGVEGKRSDRRPDTSSTVIEKTLQDVPEGALILMSHKPWQVESAAANGVGLMLSGHTHGGQIWPFGYLVKRVFPRIAGAYKIGEMVLIVCRGTGTWGPRMRLWQPGEMLKITLLRK
ncbi:MAG: metallophosphoesterase [Proteobacteria bacterium]|nr:metallophosphoesterase [Pseudomonadota bacterium]MBU1737792.1 metallophosphoesterase [Pseudomonadota bacterium]